MQKDYTRMNRPLSIIAGILMFFATLSAGTLLLPINSIYEHFPAVFKLYQKATTALNALLLALTGVMLLRGKKDLPAGMVFIAAAFYHIAGAPLYAFVIVPMSQSPNAYITLDHGYFFMIRTLLMLVWLIPAVSCFTKSSFPGEKLFFLPILVTVGYALVNVTYNLENYTRSMLFTTYSSSEKLNLFQMLIYEPSLIIRLLPMLITHLIGVLPHLFFAFAVSLPYRTNAPKVQNTYQPVFTAQSAYVPPVQQPVPTDCGAVYVPADTATEAAPAAYFPPVKEEKPTLSPYVPPIAPDDDPRVQQLQSLKNLLDQGLITQEDYDAKKKQILGL